MIVIPPLTHQFYSGRYDFAVPFLPWLVLAAALRFVEIVPRGVLGYLASPPLLNRFSVVQCAVAIIGIIIMLKWTADYGFAGILYAYTLIAVVRTIVSYIFLARALQPARRTDPSVETGERIFVEPFEAGGEEPPI
jgi:hypothetical protein